MALRSSKSSAVEGRCGWSVLSTASVAASLLQNGKNNEFVEGGVRFEGLCAADSADLTLCLCVSAGDCTNDGVLRRGRQRRFCPERRALVDVLVSLGAIGLYLGTTPGVVHWLSFLACLPWGFALPILNSHDVPQQTAS